MAIELKICYTLSSDGKTLTGTDRTGQYSALNLGGWGAPNQLIASVLVATIEIAKRNSDGTYGASTTVDVFNDLPSDTGGSIDISSSDAGQGDIFPDGVYKLIYKVTGTQAGVPFNYSVTQYKSFHPSINSCWQQLSAKSAACSCNCEEINEKFKSVTLQMRLLCAAEQKGDLNAIQQYIDFITKKCGSCGCGCP